MAQPFSNEKAQPCATTAQPPVQLRRNYPQPFQNLIAQPPQPPPYKGGALLRPGDFKYRTTKEPELYQSEKLSSRSQPVQLRVDQRERAQRVQHSTIAKHCHRNDLLGSQVFLSNLSYLTDHLLFLLGRKRWEHHVQ
jgi:hypothetical protein